MADEHPTPWRWEGAWSGPHRNAPGHPMVHSAEGLVDANGRALLWVSSSDEPEFASSRVRALTEAAPEMEGLLREEFRKSYCVEVAFDDVDETETGAARVICGKCIRCRAHALLERIDEGTVHAVGGGIPEGSIVEVPPENDESGDREADLAFRSFTIAAPDKARLADALRRRLSGETRFDEDYGLPVKDLPIDPFLVRPNALEFEEVNVLYVLGSDGGVLGFFYHPNKAAMDAKELEIGPLLDEGETIHRVAYSRKGGV